MFARVDIVTVVFGSLGGIAALVMAINTWLSRREDKKEKAEQASGAFRMDMFEMSQASLQAALARADIENKRQADEIIALKDEVRSLRETVEVLRNADIR